MKYNSKLLVILSLLSMIFFSCEEGPINPNAEGCEEIHGNWVRVRSNNPANDGMELIATGTEGTILVGRGNFNVGDIKWKDISGGGGNFTHQELGSDGNYYSASMELIADTIYVTVSSSGAGNEQKWVRKESYTDPGPSGETQILDCSISENTTLVNGPAAVDYRIDCVLDLTASLTIEPGTVIEFSQNAGIGVYDNGELKALGTSGEPIIFKGTTANKGWWRGIHIETPLSNQLDYVEIQDAAGNYVYCCNDKASLFLKDGSIEIRNTRISNGEEHGIIIRNAVEIGIFENNTITSHDKEPLVLPIQQAQKLDGLGSDFSGNGQNFVLLTDDDVTEESRLKKLNIPYELEGAVYDIKEKLTIDAGVELQMNENAGIGVFDQGALKVEGTDLEPVIMKGRESLRGYWRGIHIETNSLSNILDHLQVSNAGSNYVYCCNVVASVFLKDGRTTIRNSSITEGQGYGIATTDDFTFSGFENNVISTHDAEPLYISIEQAAELDGMNSDYSGNDEDYLHVYNSSVGNQIEIDKTNVPFLLHSVIDVTKPLTLEPGVEFAFALNAGLGVYDDGILNAIGTSTDKIIFRGKTAQPGYWRGIHTETISFDNELTHVEIRDAGSNYVYCCNSVAALFLRSGRMKVTNSYIHDNAGCGIFVRSGSTLEENGNTYAGNADGHICN
ncbi:MAG: hypothetical protein R8P61_19855 [Bacteroidia bacterium]|nr:hypothetical protein [Bacteroidia bacterium]